MLKTLKNRTAHYQVFALALPMMLSNITIPLLGLVDTIIIGHLDKASYLGGVAVGNTCITVLFWLAGFLRMATTGRSAQAVGANQTQLQAVILVQGLLVAQILAIVLIMLSPILDTLAFSLHGASDEVQGYASQYIRIRLFSSPAALANLVIIGWLLGLQNAKAAMWVLIIGNLVNIVLDIAFIMGLGWQVQGAAWASVLSDYSSLLLGCMYVRRQWNLNHLPRLSHIIQHLRQGLKQSLLLNRDIFLRSLSLQVCVSFMTFYAATLGDTIVAANAILMSCFMLVSYAMDGFAFAIEALIGKTLGRNNLTEFRQCLLISVFWCLLIGTILSLFFLFAGDDIIHGMSGIISVQQQAARFWPWLVALPLVAMWCFLLDGVFTGATRGDLMRNSMFIATCVFFAVWWHYKTYGNHALWAAMLALMAMRAIGLGVILLYHWRRNFKTLLITQPLG